MRDDHDPPHPWIQGDDLLHTALQFCHYDGGKGKKSRSTACNMHSNMRRFSLLGHRVHSLRPHFKSTSVLSGACVGRAEASEVQRISRMLTLRVDYDSSYGLSFGRALAGRSSPKEDLCRLYEFILECTTS